MIASIVTMLKSSILAQMISVITALFVAKYFDVEEVGEYGIFLMSATIISSLVYLRLELSLGHKDVEDIETEREKISKVRLFTFPVIILLVSSLSFIYEMYDDWINLVILLISIYVFANYRLMYYFLCYKGDFKKVAWFKVKLPVFLLINTCLMSIVMKTSASLMFSFIASYLIIIFLHYKRVEVSATIAEVLDLIRKKRVYLINMTLGSVLGIFSSYSIMVVISLLYSVEVVGYYAVAEKLIRTPLSLLQTSIADVLRVKLRGLENKSVAWKFFLLNTLIALFFAAMIYYFSGLVINLVLGEKWLYVTDIVVLLLPISFLQMVLQPMLPVFQQGEKSSFELVFNLIFVSVIFYFGFVVKPSQEYFFENLSLYLVPVYLIGLVYFSIFIYKK